MSPSSRITLRHPSLDEMGLRRDWLADPDMMSFNRGWAVDGDSYDATTGCIDFPVDRWRSWHDQWVREPSDRSYWFIDCEGRPIGHTFFRLDAHEARVAHIGVNIVPALRQRGLGVTALGLLLDEIRRDGRASEAVNEFEDTRLGAVRMHRALGFFRTGSIGTAPDGSPVGRWRRPL